MGEFDSSLDPDVKIDNKIYDLYVHAFVVFAHWEYYKALKYE
jgi:mannose/cellobiose epimerase-like protein (N-acyl-D-glucosamine 2-epimerase family)